MPTTCCVRGCRSRGSGKDNKIKYFRQGITWASDNFLNAVLGKFPKDEDRRIMWVQAIHREDFVPTNNSMICNAHFTKNDYQKRPDLIKLTNKAIPSVFNYQASLPRNTKIKKEVMAIDFDPSLKPIKKYHHNLSDHTYVLKLPEPSVTKEKTPEKSLIDPSMCMIQTLNVEGDESLEESHALDLSKSNKLVSKCIEDFCFKITESDNNRFEDDGKFIKDWKQIAISQSHTIKDLRKKVKVLQQKIRRHTTKIETLKNKSMLFQL